VEEETVNGNSDSIYTINWPNTVEWLLFHGATGRNTAMIVGPSGNIMILALLKQLSKEYDG
jgi:hypothetical protein